MLNVHVRVWLYILKWPILCLLFVSQPSCSREILFIRWKEVRILKDLIDPFSFICDWFTVLNHSLEILFLYRELIINQTRRSLVLLMLRTAVEITGWQKRIQIFKFDIELIKVKIHHFIILWVPWDNWLIYQVFLLYV